MAGTLEVAVGVSGLTLVASLFAEGGDTLTASYSLTEATNRKGLYAGAITDALSGNFYVLAKSGADVIWTGYVKIDNAVGTYRAGDTSTLITDTRLPSALVNGRMNSNVASLSNGAITAASIADSALNGKGDWNTITPPTISQISAQVASDLATAHGPGSWETVTGAAIRQAIGLATNNLDLQLTALASVVVQQSNDTLDALAGVITVAAKVDTMLEPIGANHRFTEEALHLAPTSSNTGPGADFVTITITAGGNPVADADIWITTDEEGTNLIAGTVQTDSNGKFRFLLDHGAQYYLWMQKDGVESIQGRLFTAERDEE